MDHFRKWFSSVHSLKRFVLSNDHSQTTQHQFTQQHSGLCLSFHATTLLPQLHCSVSKKRNLVSNPLTWLMKPGLLVTLMFLHGKCWKVGLNQNRSLMCMWICTQLQMPVCDVWISQEFILSDGWSAPSRDQFCSLTWHTTIESVSLFYRALFFVSRLWTEDCGSQGDAMQEASVVQAAFRQFPALCKSHTYILLICCCVAVYHKAG